jgi:hypothetical protein
MRSGCSPAKALTATNQRLRERIHLQGLSTAKICKRKHLLEFFQFEVMLYWQNKIATIWNNMDEGQQNSNPERLVKRDAKTTASIDVSFSFWLDNRHFSFVRLSSEFSKHSAQRIINQKVWST